jgi:hypothetical protein
MLLELEEGSLDVEDQELCVNRLLVTKAEYEMVCLQIPLHLSLKRNHK